MKAHYLKVIMDEIFGRKNLIAEVIWQKRTSRENRAAIGSAARHHLSLCSNGSAESGNNTETYCYQRQRVRQSRQRSAWSMALNSVFCARFGQNQMYTITSNTGVSHKPPKGRCWAATEPEFEKLRAAGRVYFPKQGKGKPRIKAYPEEDEGMVPMSLVAADVGTTEEAKKEILELFNEDDPFGTPKPERLMRQILLVASKPGDLVLDSFLGSARRPPSRTKWDAVISGSKWATMP